MASLAITSQNGDQKKVSPNLLPCQIHHDGKIEVSQRHWDPKVETDGKQSVHFRGRRLFGRNVKIPHGQRGVVVKVTENKLEKAAQDEDEDEEELDETFVAEETATFDHLTIWNHDVVPEAGEDEYIKGIEEWIGMAEAIHSS